MAHSPLRLIVVEDHANTAEGLKKFLKAVGYEVFVATDMTSALWLATSVQFDLLLSDISLPDGDGWELLRCLSEAGLRPRRAIAISGRCSIQDLARSQEAGFDHHFCKPVEMAVLEAILRDAAEEVTG